MFNVGTQELLIILVVALLLFGAKRIPEVARSFGKGLSDFREAMGGLERELRDETLGRPTADLHAMTRPAPPKPVPAAEAAPQRGPEAAGGEEALPRPAPPAEVPDRSQQGNAS